MRRSKRTTFVHATILRLLLTSDINLSKKTQDNFSLEVYEDKAERNFFRNCFYYAIAYARSLMRALMSMVISHTSLLLYVLSFVLACACAYVASENQPYRSTIFTTSCLKQVALTFCSTTLLF